MKKASKQQTTPFLQILLTVCVLQGSLISRHRIKGLRQITYTSKQTNVLCSLPHPLCCCAPRATLSSLQPALDGKHHKQWLKSSSSTINASLTAQVFTSFSGWGANHSDARICHNRNTSFGLRATNTAPLLATLSCLRSYLIACRQAAESHHNLSVLLLLLSSWSTTATAEPILSSELSINQTPIAVSIFSL